MTDSNRDTLALLLTVAVILLALVVLAREPEPPAFNVFAATHSVVVTV